MSTIECGICFLKYNEEARTPRVLTNCGHTICQQCAIKLTDADANSRLTCPFDRKLTQLNRNKGVHGLPKNFALLELFRKANQEPEQKSRTKVDAPCFENPSHEAVFYCEQCDVELCDSCFTSVHKSKSLSTHQKTTISGKPIKLPKCPNHPHNIAEFLCTDPNCRNSTKIMCRTCVLFDQHKSHKIFSMEKLHKNEQLLKDLLKRNEQHQREGKKIIEKTKKSLESFDESGPAFEIFARKISDKFDMKKDEALRQLAEFVNDKKKKQTALKIKLEKEYSESMKRKDLIEKKLKMKDDLQNTDDITSLKSNDWSRLFSQDEPDSLLDYDFIVPNMNLQIQHKPKE
ncbi:unnamed protein product [Caenorhabditis brenneri]